MKIYEIKSGVVLIVSFLTINIFLFVQAYIHTKVNIFLKKIFNFALLTGQHCKPKMVLKMIHFVFTKSGNCAHCVRGVPKYTAI